MHWATNRAATSRSSLVLRDRELLGRAPPGDALDDHFDARLVRHTLPVLLLVAALPFPASVLATYGENPSALVFYAVFNVAANVALLVLLADVHAPRDERARLWADIAVLVVCIPGAYLLGDNGPWLLLLLAVSGRAPKLLRRAT